MAENSALILFILDTGANSEDPDEMWNNFDLILYVPSTIVQFNRDGSSWVEPVLS